jgi:hypothetical protein
MRGSETQSDFLPRFQIAGAIEEDLSKGVLEAIGT